MRAVEHSILVEASLAETWDHFFDQRGWRAWVEGFDVVLASEGDYPQSGGTLRWRSAPAGRGEVLERVIGHEHRRCHRIAFEDPTMAGELETRFAIEGHATRVSQRLTYKLRQRGFVAALAAVFFVRSQLRNSIKRTLAAFKHEVEYLAQERPA